MSTVQTMPDRQMADFQEPKPELHHFCAVCYPVPRPGQISACGHVTNVDGPVFVVPPASWPLCVVCEDLYELPCARCGA